MLLTRFPKCSLLSFRHLTGSVAAKPREDLRIVRLTKDDHSAVYNFMCKDFLYTESLNQALDLKLEETDDFHDIIASYLEHPISYGMKNELDQIVGMRLCSVLHRPRNGENPVEPPPKNWKLAEIFKFISKVESKMWDYIPSTWNQVMYFGILSVDKAYARRGIGKALADHNMQEVKDLGCQGIVTELSALKSQQLFLNRLGYHKLYELLYKDWLDKKGNPIFTCHFVFNMVTVLLLSLRICTKKYKSVFVIICDAQPRAIQGAQGIYFTRFKLTSPEFSTFLVHFDRVLHPQFNLQVHFSCNDKRADEQRPSNVGWCLKRSLHQIASEDIMAAHNHDESLSVENLTEKDSSEVVKFLLLDFLRSEPLNSAVGNTAEEATPLFEDIVSFCLSSPLSYAVKNAENQIVGVRLAGILRRPEGDLIKPPLPEYAKTLLSHRLEEARELGCQGIVTQATAYKSQQLFVKKLGYRAAYEILHEDWVDEQGNRVFKCLDGTDRGILAIKEL
ncbi:hypothetical protein QR680_006588 [Steinernema hermaphroditum]|uniref:N-acetyltransferase domain-containing protein n=1 Tax=Steinernema hermaphroditum TaxID=289476 RepID=A0AA39HXD8_9BILA|nr:hypothetical protein QR680_006588 [Steinernema hermaphroditum]